MPTTPTRHRGVRAVALSVVLVLSIAACDFLDALDVAIQELIAGGFAFDSAGNVSAGGFQVLTQGRTEENWRAKDEAANEAIANATDEEINKFLVDQSTSSLNTLITGDTVTSTTLDNTLTNQLTSIQPGTDPTMFTADGNGEFTIVYGPGPDDVLEVGYDIGGNKSLDTTGIDPDVTDNRNLSPGMGVGSANRPIMEKYYPASLPPNKTGTGQVSFSSYIGIKIGSSPTVYPIRRIGLDVTRSVVNGVVVDKPIITPRIEAPTTPADPFKGITATDLITDVTVVGPVSGFEKDSDGNWRGGRIQVVVTSAAKVFGADITKTIEVRATVSKNGDVFFQADAPLVVEAAPDAQPNTLPGRVLNWLQQFFK